MNDALLESKRVTVLDLLDQLLETGVVVDGEIDLSVADIDLIHLGLKLVLASSATLEQHSNGSGARVVDPPDDPPADLPDESPPGNQELVSTPPIAQGSRLKALGKSSCLEPTASSLEPHTAPRPERPGDQKINFEPAKVEQGLAKLVLTLVELIRRLMEKQAIRKMEGGTLNRSQLEQLGEAFRRLESKMVELKRVFGLEDDDLNLDLGPLGELM